MQIIDISERIQARVYLGPSVYHFFFFKANSVFQNGYFHFYYIYDYDLNKIMYGFV